MKFTRSRYPGYPGTERYSSPCWKLTGRRAGADADWNTRFPFGVSLGITGPGWFRFCLDMNAPLGEPNRLYLTGPRRNYMLGLVSWHTQIETGTRRQVIMGREQTVHQMKTIRCWPRLIRGQAWDWKRSEGSDRWCWLVAHPNDSRERWARAHPEEAAEAERRLAEYKARTVT